MFAHVPPQQAHKRISSYSSKFAQTKIPVCWNAGGILAEGYFTPLTTIPQPPQPVALLVMVTTEQFSSLFLQAKLDNTRAKNMMTGYFICCKLTRVLTIAIPETLRHFMIMIKINLPFRVTFAAS